MAKTLVGLYDTFTDAEQVVQDLVKHGFDRSDVWMTTHNGQSRSASSSYAAETRMDDRDGLETLTDYGVPAEEARSYMEGVRRGGTLVVVKASDEQADRGMEIMNRLQPIDIHDRMAQWRKEGWTGSVSNAASSTAVHAGTTARQGRESHGRRVEGDRDVTIPVVEEELTVGTREVERGRVRVHSRVEQHPVEEQVRIHEEKVTVERHPVNRPATEADLKASAEETIELTETAEVPVVEKRARVVEEVVVRKEVDEHVETVRETVRRKDVDVDRETTGRMETGRETVRTAAAPDFSTYMADWRRHHTTTFAGSGTTYEDYEPAYRYGYELGTAERYRGRDWAALESEARRDWEARRSGTWERFKDAIRYGWDKVRTGDTTSYRDRAAEPTTATRSGTIPDFANYASDYRTHHSATFANSGLSYQDYEPAYRYGYELGTTERYRGRDWAALESEARRDWEARRPGTWEQFKDAIRYGWDKIRR